jgi:hypothetical protein
MEILRGCNMNIFKLGVKGEYYVAKNNVTNFFQDIIGEKDTQIFTNMD